MRIKSIACAGFTLMASLAGLKADTSVLSAWTFDNLAVSTTNSSPAPSTGSGSASALGMANSYNNTNSLSNPIIVSQPGSSGGNANAWQISGNGAPPVGGDGWSTNAPIGTQGAQFSGSTFGYYRVNLSFDVYVPSTGEANLQVQYTTQGTIWTTAPNIILEAGSSAQIENNSTSTNTVSGNYVKLAQGWNNGITVNLGGISGVDNNPNFAVRIVNASTGADDVDTTGAVYNNTSGNWTFDNVVIQGTSIDAIADWTFQLYGTGVDAANAGYVENPIPDINLADGQAVAACIGFDVTNFNFGSGLNFSTNAPDVTSQSGSSTPNNPYCWRLRGVPGNGWASIEPVGSQGAEFDVSTINYSNVVLTFDMYFTSQAEAKMCVLYTTNGWTNTFTADTLGYGANPLYIVTNDASVDPNTVDGTFFYQNVGQNWYNDLVVDFTGVPGVDNNPNFGIRIVNAATGVDDINYTGGAYNNSSGNARLGNVSFGGQFEGSVPPAITAAANATVDHPFTNTFTDDPIWRANIATVYVNNVPLTNSAFNVSNAGELIFNPSQSAQLQVAGLDSIVIFATNYSTARISQYVGAGVFKKLGVTISTAGPSASGGTLESNPELSLVDQYNNTTTNPYANVVVTASVSPTNAPGWTLGGATVQPEIGGVIQFTNLSATVTGNAAINGAAVELSVSGYTNTANQTTTTNFALPTFNIGAPPLALAGGNLVSLEIDTLSNNTTFSMIEVKPSSTNSSPVTIVPISASTTNALREASAGTTGRLALSDDGTLLTFAAFVDGSSATPDETLNLFRAAVGMTYTNTVTLGMTYTSTSLGGSQARAAVTIDDVNYFGDDKGGLYFGNGYQPYANVDNYNNVVVKSFGGTAYVETQKAIAGLQIPVVYYVINGGQGLGFAPEGNNLGNDPNATDFYLIDGTNVMYTCDQISSTEGVINKYSWAPNVNQGNPDDAYGWASSGSWTNGNGVDGMFVTTNGNGGAYIYYTTGSGGTSGNSIVRVTDSAGYNQSINIISTNLVYTTPKGTSMKGLVFAPQATAYAAEPIPTPFLGAAVYAGTNAPFNVTLTPDDSGFRANITLITVNGVALPPSAYSTSTAGVITLIPSQSAALQTPGTKTIGFAATGYSTNSLTQLLVGAASQLVITTQPTAPAADGAALAKQPVVKLEDAANDVIPIATNILAAPAQATWTLVGSTNVATSAGVATYSGVSAFSGSAVTGATITFSVGGLTATSSPFNIPAPIYSVMHKGNIASGKFAFTFTNATSLTYSVLATNNLSAPVSTWPVIGTTTENPAGSGVYVFTNGVGTNGDLFYILRQNP